MTLSDCFHKLRADIRPDDRTAITRLIAEGQSDLKAVRTVLGQAVSDVLAVAETIELAGGVVQRRDAAVTDIAQMQMRILESLRQERLNLNAEVAEVKAEKEIIEATEQVIQNYAEDEIPVNLEDPQAVQTALSEMFFTDPARREVFLGPGVGGLIKGTSPTELMASWEAMQQRHHNLLNQELEHEIRSRLLEEREQTIFYGERRNPRKLFQSMDVAVPWKLKSTGEGDIYIRRHGVNAGMPFRERQGPNDFAITFDSDVLLPDYMFYLLTYLQPKIAERARGTAQQAIRLDDINAVLVNHFMGQELFQDSGGPRLQALHNLTTGDLTFADSFGGLAMPSIAVLPAERGLDRFGNITLIGKEDLGDPQQVPLFDRDAYAVRTPRAQHKAASLEAIEPLVEVAAKWAKLIEGSQYVGLPDHITEYARRRPNAQKLYDHMLYSNAAKAWFLNETFGEDPTPTVDDVRPGFIWGWSPQVIKFFEGDLSAENLAWEDPRRIKLMKRAAAAVKAGIRHHHIMMTSLGKRQRDAGSEAARAEQVWLLTQRSMAVAGIIGDDNLLNFQAYERLKRDVKRKGSTQINDVDTKTYLDDRIRARGAESQFKAWIDAKVHGVMGEGRIKIGSKWYPYNMKNVLRKMRGKLRATETAMPSEGLLAAKAANRIKNLDEARRRALTQIDTPEKVLKARDVSQKMMIDWIEELKVWWPYNPSSLASFSDASDAAREATIFWIQNKDGLSDTKAMIRGLERAGYVGPFSDEVIQQGLDAAAATIANPTAYFEAKPQRAVTLDEFAGAVIPLDEPPETRAILQKHGIPYIEYKPGDSASRMIALFHLQSEISKKGGETLFQDDLGFYSGLLNAAQNMPREKGTAADMLGTLMKQPGARKAEAEHIGLPEYLEGRGKDTITREELATFIERGGLQVKETLYAGGVIDPNYNPMKERAPEAAYEELMDPDTADFPYAELGIDIWDIRDRNFSDSTTFRVWHDEDAGNVRVMDHDTGLDIPVDDPINSQGMDSAYKAIEEYLIERQKIPGAKGIAKWSIYTLPGNDLRHREIVLHMPEIVPVRYKMELLEEVEDPSLVQDKGDKFWFIAAQVPIDPTITPTASIRNDQIFQLLKKDYPTIEAAKQYIVDEKQPGSDYSYNMSVHGYGELNIMGWARITDRKGPDGQLIMHIEEMQSPLHQWGATAGYRGNPAQIAAAKAKVESFRLAAIHAVRENQYLGFDTFNDAIEALLEQHRQLKEMVKARARGETVEDVEPWQKTYAVTKPHHITALNDFLEALDHESEMVRQESEAPLDFPFKGNAWLELVAKRLIRLAAEGGYDQIAWTTGAQQQERYSLASIAHKIEYDPRSETVKTYNEAGDRQISQHVPLDKLGEFIGQEPALEIKKQIDLTEAQYEVVTGRSADVVRGDIYGRATDAPDDPYLGFVLIDQNGELARDLGGGILANMGEQDMIEERAGLLYEHNVPTLTGRQIVGEDKFLNKLYDKVLINVMNKVARKLDKNAKVKRKGIIMEGGVQPDRMTLEHDGESYYIEGVPADKPTDAPRERLSPRFKTLAEADAWRDARPMGFANEQHGLTLTADIKGNAMLGQTYMQGKHRASITFDDKGRGIMRMAKARDMSSFLHEGAHMWLNIKGDLAERPNAPQKTIDDYAKILKFLGVNKRSEITFKEHEIWAKSQELYYMEGVAPTHELQPLFSAFNVWLTQVYKHITGYFDDIELNDEIRGVMDRMVATDEAIKNAEALQEYRPIFATAAEANMSPEAFAVYRSNTEQTHQDAVEEAHRKQLAFIHRQAQTWWQHERERIEEQVTAEVHAMPVYIALAHLQRGQLPDGSPVVSPAPFKISKESLLRAVQGSQEFLKRFPGRGRSAIYSVKGGADVDIAAGRFGYADAKDMLQAMVTARPMDELIQFETDRLMDERFPDPMTDGTLAADALVAVHNDKRATVLAAELKALRRLQRRDSKIVGAERRAAAREDREGQAAAKGLLPTRAELSVIKKLAKSFISKLKIREINPNKYRLAEQSAGRRAWAAIEKKDWATAYDEKAIQMRNHEAFREAVRAKDEAGRTQKYLKGFEKPVTQRRLGKAGILDPILAVIEGLDLRRRSLAEVDRNAAMAEILRAVEEGHIIVPQETLALLADVGTNWQELTVQEFRELRDVVKQLENMPKRTEMAMVNGEEVNLQEVETEIADSIKAANKVVDFGVAEETGAKGFAVAIREGVYHSLSVGSISRILDGSAWGALTKRLAVPIRRAYAEKLIPMFHQYQQDVAEMYLKHYSDKELADMADKKTIEGFTEKLSRSDVLSLGLNWGSETGRAAVLGGVLKDIDGNIVGNAFPQADVMAALATLDARDWAFIQEMWDYLDTYWFDQKDASGEVIREGLSTVEKRRRGVAPQRIERMPFKINTADGVEVTLKGGYYHLWYNPKHGDAVKADDLNEVARKMGQGLYVSASTRAGSTYNRVKNHGRVVRLGLGGIDQHLREVIRDIAIGDEINYVMRLLNSDTVRRAFNFTNNDVALRELVLWATDSAVGELPASNVWEKIAGWSRVGFTKSKLAFSITVTLLQITGAFQSMAFIGKRNFMAGFGKFLQNPAGHYKYVMETSKFMHTRYGVMQSFSVEVADAQAFMKGVFGPVPTQFSRNFKTFSSKYFFMIAKAQSLVDVWTWMGAYHNGRNNMDLSEIESRKFADSQVEGAQTSGIFADRSGIERGTLGNRTRQSQYVRLFTTLISYMIRKQGLAYEATQKYKRGDRTVGDAASLLTDYVMLFMVEGVASQLVYGNWPETDDEEEMDAYNIAAWVGLATLDSLIAGIPFLREISTARYGSGNTPIGSLTKDVFDVIMQAKQGELDEEAITTTISALGTALHLPSSQVNRAIEAYMAEDAEWYEYLIGVRK